MCCLQRSLLPLLILLFFQSPEMMRAESQSQQKVNAEVLLAFKSAAGDPPSLKSWMGREPCLQSWIGVQCSGKFQNSTVIAVKLTGYKLEGVISPAIQYLTSLITLWLDDNHLRGRIPSGLGNLKNLTSLRLSNNALTGRVPSSLALLPRLKELTLMNNHLRGSLPFDGTFSRVMDISVHGNTELCSSSGSYNLSVCGPSSAPALTFTSSPPALTFSSPDIHQSGSGKAKSKVGAIVGGALAEWVKGHESPMVAGAIPLREVPRARVFSLAELEHATDQFIQNKLIGQGSFGLVYKGILHDGRIIAIKTRTSSPSLDFVKEVQYLCHIYHRHLVSLLGYCQENDQQMLVYDYMPNGSVCNHLYDSDGNSLGKLDFRQRLSIALDAAKGLEHLHALAPPLVHKGFKTSNVLVDENYIAKVTDFGLSQLLAGIHGAGSSSPVDVFLDPDFNASRSLHEKSDVYSFGVFLLELISGCEALRLNSPASEQNLVNWAQSLRESNKLVALIDSKMNQNYTDEAIKDFMDVAFQCLEFKGERRPTMNEVRKELDRILEKERGQTADTVEGAAVVTLGSELFRV
ncbi:leucine-rich repeat receptor protein kinase HPCA1 isoform X2 [Cryptomeria japonica]|uniref:leucine-rich repeat receptor protein kinase HPCA1 isoform X2 n=1 Tax=Cryptomeria japonica TaxID=3369 RepID=UPI0025AB6597|nr:leucine-rich repeat receptor protein kinase HPCA1 isoform X2 [Cryptomeria japonica]